MPTCCVPYCANASTKDSRLTFHEFPHETPLFLNKWLENIGRPNWHPGVRSVVCSEHFVKDDFDRKGRLHIGSFPSIFPESPFRKKKKELELNLSKPQPKVILQSDTVNKLSCGVHSSEEPLIKSNSTLKSVTELPAVTCREGDTSSSKTLTVSQDENDVFVIQGPVDVSVEQVSSTTSEMAGKISEPPEGNDFIRKRKLLEEQSSEQPSIKKMVSVAPLLSCRICGYTNKLNTSIFGDDGKRLGLAQMISKCLPIEVSKTESLPHSLCINCISKLKASNDLIDTCERTNNIFKKKGMGEKDAVIIHSRPFKTSPSSKPSKRILLLEMPLKEGIPVKDMLSQAIEELTLRLKPKELRVSKPQGRIMFLDLRGESETFPEQMKSAISMLFQSPSIDKKPVITRVQKNLASSSSILKSPESRTPSTLASAISGSCPPLMMKPIAPVMASANVSQNPLVQKPVAAIMSSANMSQNPPVPTSPMLSTVPFTLLPNSSMLSSTIQVAALPHTVPASMPPFNSNQSLSFPPQSLCSLIKIQARPNMVNAALTSPGGNQVTPVILPKAQNNSSGSISTKNNKDMNGAVPPLVFIRELPAVCSSTPTKTNEAHSSLVMPTVPQSPIAEVPEATAPAIQDAPVEVVEDKSGHLDLNILKDKLFTKINSVGKQIKLGDKIVGIVVRNSDSSDIIKKKLQETFSKSTPLNEKEKTAVTRKERPILPKASVSIPSSDMVIEGVDKEKMLKGRVMDICPASDKASYFERRNVRKPSLSFLWRKTGFLVSSYQKLYTWIIPDDSENSNPLLSCRVCKFVAKSKQEVEGHLGAHPDLQCGLCQKYFLTVDKVHEHLKVIHLKSSPTQIQKKRVGIYWRNNASKRAIKHYQCSRCERRFKYLEILRNHYLVCKEKTLAGKVVAITNANVLTCPVCNRSFTTNAALSDHMLSHARRTTWLCDVCGAVLKSQSNYRAHVARHDEKAHEFKYQCSICKKRFKLSNRYEDHIKSHEAKKNQQYICSSCGKVFRTVNGLRQHEILHGERKFPCRYCPSRFHRRDHQRIHEDTHLKTKTARKSGSSGGPRLFTCRFCPPSADAKFSNMRLVLKHYEQDHNLERGRIPGSMKFSCDQCSKTFLNSTLLRHHLLWHAGQRPYHCSTCGAGFMVRERLRNHEWTHTNERPFKCQACGKGFRSRNCLKQHKLIHKDPSEYFKCQFCDKGFSRIDNLRTHTRVHTGEKPWKCLDCSKQFRLRSDCTKHLNSAHSIPQAEIFEHMETVIDPYNPSTIPAQLSPSTVAQSPPPDSVIDAAIAGLNTGHDVEIVLEDNDLV